MNETQPKEKIKMVLFGFACLCGMCYGVYQLALLLGEHYSGMPIILK